MLAKSSALEASDRSIAASMAVPAHSTLELGGVERHRRLSRTFEERQLASQPDVRHAVNK
jgi:hypothetical protein